MLKIKHHECLFCYKEFEENNLIKLKCNCSNDYFYCQDCLFIWEQKKVKNVHYHGVTKNILKNISFLKKVLFFLKTYSNSCVMD